MDDTSDERHLELNLTRNHATGEHRVIANMSVPVTRDLLHDLERDTTHLTPSARAFAALTRQLLEDGGLTPPRQGRGEAND